MKYHPLLLLGLLTVLGGTTQASQEALASSMKEARLEATRASEQLKAALDALNALAKQTQGDLRPAYQAFATQIPKVEAAATWTRARVQWMQGDGRRYFSTWQKTVDGLGNESLRKKAQKRLDTVQKSYDKVLTTFQASGEQFRGFLSDLNDIQKTLALDVTPGGVKAVRSTVSHANWNYQGVNRSMQSALKELLKMEQALSPELK